VKLNIGERIVLNGLLAPVSTNYVTLKLIREFREALSFSEKEMKKAGLRETDNNMVAWEPDKDFEKEINVPDKVREKVVEILKKLDESDALMSAHLSLYEKFVEVDSS
jgi:hypothetical protein